MAHLLEYSLWLLLAVTAIGVAGFAGTRLCRCTEGDPLIRVVLFGAFAWVHAVFLLGVGQAMNGFGLLAIGLLSGLLAVLGWKKKLPAATQSSGPPLPARDSVQLGLAALLALALCVFFVERFFFGTRPTISWDAGHYHLTLPRMYLDHGGFRQVPFNYMSDLPAAAQMLYVAAIATKDFILAKGLHWAAGVCWIVVAWRFASRESGIWSGASAATLAASTTTVGFLASTAYVDLFVSLFHLCAVVLFIHAFTAENRRQALMLSGLAAGLTVATKLTAVYCTVALCLLYVFEFGLEVRNRRAAGESAGLGAETRTLVRDLLSLGWIPALMVVPWLLKNWYFTGNPLYPLLTDVFGGAWWNAKLNTQAQDLWLASYGYGNSPMDLLKLPFRVLASGHLGLGEFSGKLAWSWLFAVPLALIGVRDRATRTCLLHSAIFFVFWARESHQLRYLLPALGPLAIAASLGFSGMLTHVRDRRIAHAARVALTAVLLSGLVSVSPLREAMKADTVVDYLDLATFESRETRNPVHDFIRDELPPDARLMLLNTNQGFWVEREFISDNFWGASQLDWLFRQRETTAEIQELMHELDVDFVVWYGRYWKVDYPESFNLWLRDQNYARVVYQQEPYVIVQVAPPGRPASTPAAPQ